MSDPSPLLTVKDLEVVFTSKEGDVRAVDGLSFAVYPNEVLGIVGESGSGKSVTCLAVLNLLSINGRIAGGSIRLESGGRFWDVHNLDEDGKPMRRLRGKEIAMVFQEPMSALSPLHTIGNQIGEAIRMHGLPDGRLSWVERRRFVRQRTIEMLDSVGMPTPGELLDSYPHQLSGGLRQRAVIAMALACRPKILIADEPTTALDVTLQAQVLELLEDLQQRNEMSVIFITHDLGVIAEVADRVLVMYLGRGMETAPVDELFHDPLHPYTRALLRSIPHTSGALETLIPISGTVPGPYWVPSGCPFHTRCEEAIPGVCDVRVPIPVEVTPGHEVACFLHHDVGFDRNREDG